MVSVDIFKNESVHITYDNESEIFKVKLLDNSIYDDKGFHEALDYVKNTFIYVKDNKLKCSFICDLRTNTGVELPLHAYVSLVTLITDINSTLITNCHCIIIISHDSQKWKDVYNFVTKLWRPAEQRPLEFMNNDDDISDFILKNKLCI